MARVTKAAARRLARSARRYGYSKRSDTEGDVRCPRCHRPVAFYKLASERFTAATMDAAVIAHLREDCGGGR
jgi:uncharacterized paraquat-inducible protein A